MAEDTNISNKEIADNVISQWTEQGYIPSKANIQLVCRNYEVDRRRHIARYLYAHYEAELTAQERRMGDIGAQRDIILADLFAAAQDGDARAREQFLRVTRDEQASQSATPEQIRDAIDTLRQIMEERVLHYTRCASGAEAAALYRAEREAEIAELERDLAQ